MPFSLLMETISREIRTGAMSFLTNQERQEKSFTPHLRPSTATSVTRAFAQRPSRRRRDGAFSISAIEMLTSSIFACGALSLHIPDAAFPEGKSVPVSRQERSASKTI